jgi:hypothetical protein|tara:strand:- start:2498 stop:4021 length:1524 start_codon:yes stop_codon:yes gene_type:complete
MATEVKAPEGGPLTGIEGLTEEQRAELHEVVVWEQARRDFIFFLDYVRIQEPPPGLGTIKFVKWPHILELADVVLGNSLVVVLKARQLGFSWLVGAYSVWKVVFQPPAVVLMFSRGEVEANALLSKAKFIYKELPEGWKTKVAKDSNSQFELDSGAKILAFPSTEESGRSETASLVIQDEADFHNFLEANYRAVKPTIDAGGQMIQGSTVNKKKPRSLFKQLYRGAPGNGWKKLFMGWRSRPGRDQAWYEGVRNAVPDMAEATDMSPDLYMEQEYPGSAEEALKASRAIGAFNQDVLDQMREDARRPVETVGSYIRIYQRFRLGRKYGAGTDTSHGVGGDFGVTALIDLNSGAVVADIMSQELDPEQLAEESLRLLKRYRSPVWAIEDNEWGIITIKAAQRERYPRLYRRPSRNGRSPEPGWHTDELSRYTLWGELIQAIESQLLTIFNADGLAHFYDVIRNPENKGRIEGVQGGHDDYPMAVGMAWQMRKYSHTSGGGSAVVGSTW